MIGTIANASTILVGSIIKLYNFLFNKLTGKEKKEKRIV